MTHLLSTSWPLHRVGIYIAPARGATTLHSTLVRCSSRSHLTELPWRSHFPIMTIRCALIVPDCAIKSHFDVTRCCCDTVTTWLGWGVGEAIYGEFFMISTANGIFQFNMDLRWLIIGSVAEFIVWSLFTFAVRIIFFFISFIGWIVSWTVRPFISFYVRSDPIIASYSQIDYWYWKIVFVKLDMYGSDDSNTQFDLIIFTSLIN